MAAGGRWVAPGMAGVAGVCVGAAAAAVLAGAVVCAGSGALVWRLARDLWWVRAYACVLA